MSEKRKLTAIFIGCILLISCCCISIMLAGISFYREATDSDSIFRKDNCELRSERGDQPSVRTVMEFYACDNEILILNVKDETNREYDDIYAVFNYDTTDDTYTKIAIWKDNEDGYADTIDTYPIGEYARLQVQENTLLNNRYLFFLVMTEGLVECELVEGEDLFKDSKCYTDRDLDSLDKWGGFYVYDKDKKEFLRLFAYERKKD